MLNILIIRKNIIKGISLNENKKPFTTLQTTKIFKKLIPNEDFLCICKGNLLIHSFPPRS